MPCHKLQAQNLKNCFDTATTNGARPAFFGSHSPSLTCQPVKTLQLSKKQPEGISLLLPAFSDYRDFFPLFRDRPEFFRAGFVVLEEENALVPFLVWVFAEFLAVTVFFPSLPGL